MPIVSGALPEPSTECDPYGGGNDAARNTQDGTPDDLGRRTLLDEGALLRLICATHLDTIGSEILHQLDQAFLIDAAIIVQTTFWQDHKGFGPVRFGKYPLCFETVFFVEHADQRTSGDAGHFE
jgi:hypothetical protein